MLGELFRMRRTHGESIPADPAPTLYELVWNAKRDILLLKTQSELDRIEGQFVLAERFVAKTDFTGNALQSM